VLGFDVLIDRDLRPWILEVNANPSLAITQEMIASDGTKSVSVSELDLFVKSKVIEDAFVIAMHDPADQLKLVQRGHYFNSYKMLIDGSPSIENIDTVPPSASRSSRRCYGYLGTSAATSSVPSTAPSSVD
jgi:tubulin polyglutamylase TTLL11